VKHWLRHRPLTLALAATLALASTSAAALGLGQIEVRSRAGQPLLAEIPIVSDDPSELEQLQARLASPDTFARIGLEPPAGVVADLQFNVALDNAGRPVIRVTTTAPVTEPMLTFLVEVDWGQGRLVREYSALVDAPRTVSAPAQPPVLAPIATPPAVVQRPVETEPSPAATLEPAPSGLEPTPQSDVAGGEYGPVKRGESVSEIAARLGLNQDVSLDQAMVALLRANPDAFIGGNINRLLQGTVLRVPERDEIAAVDASEAARLVRPRVEAVRSPVQAALTASPAAAAEGASPRAAAQATTTTGTKSAPARLAIVPPGASRATRAGTQSGLQAGGEGTMLRQELQQTKETLAARDAELQELRTRVAELERLQTDQQKLVALKDSELAAAQQRLAQAQKAAATVPAKAQPAQQATPSSLPWFLGGAGLLALLLGGWWLSRRNARPAFRAPDAPSISPLAASFARDAAPVPPRIDPVADVPPPAAPADALPPGALAGTPDVHDFRETPARDSALETADNLAGDRTVIGTRRTRFDRVEAAAGDAFVPLFPSAVATHAPSPASVVEAPVTTAPVFEAPVAATTDAMRGAHGVAGTDSPGVFDSPSEVGAPVNERIELAQAYLELGDRDSARQLLGEVVVNGDHASRQQAARMLRELE